MDQAEFQEANVLDAGLGVIALGLVDARQLDFDTVGLADDAGLGDAETVKAGAQHFQGALLGPVKGVVDLFLKLLRGSPLAAASHIVLDLLPIDGTDETDATLQIEPETNLLLGRYDQCDRNAHQSNQNQPFPKSLLIHNNSRFPVYVTWILLPVPFRPWRKRVSRSRVRPPSLHCRPLSPSRCHP